MTDPFLALSILVALALIVCILAWPRTGLLPRLVRRLRRTERVLVEDALKHLHSCGRRGVACTVQSLAGQLGVSVSKAADLLDSVAAQGLAVEGEGGPKLTDSGEAWALRLVRTHRLWESYLAERTGVAPADWHEEAERVEHRLSPEAANTLAARLGHPRRDPHGDPIPTAEGELPGAETLSLVDAPLETELVVAHLEDEPPSTFVDLLALGLGLGQRLAILARDGTSVLVSLDGRELALGATAARNVGVRPVAAIAERRRRKGLPPLAAAPASGLAPGSVTLATLSPGRSGRVSSISPACSGPQRRRLLDLGVVPGAKIEAELEASGGDPVAYRICGALVALRNEQADWVRVVPSNPGEAGSAP